jgi:hypothetical protein
VAITMRTGRLKDRASVIHRSMANLISRLDLGLEARSSISASHLGASDRSWR